MSLALTLLDETLRLYVNGVLAGTATDCTPPILHSDDVTRLGGIVVAQSFSNAPGSVNLTVSDLRISRLARVPGQVPA